MYNLTKWCSRLFLSAGFVFFALLTTSSATTERHLFNEPFTLIWQYQPTTIEPNSNDFLVANQSLSTHIFDPLFTLNRDGTAYPVLVESFAPESQTSWLFTLKQGVKFHDGSELSSDDVMATFDRLNRQNDKNPFRQIIQPWKHEKVSRYQFRIKTKSSEPELPSKLIFFFIINKKAEQATRQQFDNMQFVNGTGPYRLVSHKGFKDFSFTAFEDYHRGTAYLQQVNGVVEQDVEQRIKRFLQRQADFIGGLSPSQVERVLAEHKANVDNATSGLLYTLKPDVYRDQSPYIFDHLGKPLKSNPLKDRRVRQAISLAIDRHELVDKIYGGVKGATPIGQLVPPSLKGFNRRLVTPQQDIAKARQLLADAGYPKGFSITLHDKEARSPLLELISAMLNKVGIKSQVEALPPKEFFPRSHNHEFSLSGLLNKVVSLSAAMNDIIFSTGNNNDGRYANPEIDKLILKTNQQFNDTLRLRQFRYAAELAMKDQAVVPLFFKNELSLIRSDMVFLPMGERLIDAYSIKPVDSH